MSRRDGRRTPSRRPEVGHDAPLRAGGSARGRHDGPIPASPPDWRLFAALLPLRFFVGATFLYAGIDKLIDPRFLTASGPGSIGEQLTAFSRASPLAGLVSVFAMPFPVLIGVLMALAEIAIGLGALTGLLYRVSAAAGAAVSLLFFLTASWTVHPYYYGPDLPYAAAWLTLALAGHGGLAVLRVPFPAVFAPYGDPAEASPERRTLLKGGLLAVAAVAVAGVAGVGGGLLRGRDHVAAIPAATPGASPTVAGASPTPGTAGPGTTAAAPTPAASPAHSAPPVAGQIATLASLKPRTALGFTDPTSGDPGILVRLADGTVVAFDALCTHQGCTVEYDQPSGLLACPCHGAVFDPTHNADVLQGPARVALAALPIVVDKATGAITLRG
jgi:thiosulfate dehydrogenase [quinone] large subunit